MSSLEALTPRQRDFLAAIRDGKTGRAWATDSHYSYKYAEKLSRAIRDRLGVTTIAEAVAMSELSPEVEARLKKLERELEEARQDLREAKTPAQRRDAEEDVREARADLKSELSRRGLTESDLDKLQEDKEYERFKGREERLRKEREEEEARRAQDDDDAVEPPPAPTKTPKAEKPVEEKPESSHFSERPLWGRGRGEAA